MSRLAPESNDTSTDVAKVNVHGPDGQPLVHELRPESSLVVGSSESCDVRLEGADIAAWHCWLNWVGDGIYVRDCYSSAGTFVNGERISDDTKIVPGAEITVGSFRILIDLPAALCNGVSAPAPAAGNDASEPTAPNTSIDRASVPSTLDALKDNTPQLSALNLLKANVPELSEANAFENRSAEQTGNETSGFGNESHIEPANERLNEELQQSRAEVDRLQTEIEQLRAQSSARPSASRIIESDPFDQEIIQLLRDEMESLQQELTERDAQLEELKTYGSADANTSASDPQESATDTAALVDRLEKLLDELERGDERVASLEELLRLAEETSHAEQEERRQIEDWIGDLEQRVTEREAEREAENEVLRQRLEAVSAERDRAEKQLDQHVSGSVAAAEHESLTQDLRKQLAAVEQRLEESEKERGRLAQQLQSVDADKIQERIQQEIEQQVREERLTLAEERAENARVKEEFERVQSDLSVERQENKANSRRSEDVNQRLRVFRDHLKEIHAQEKEEKKEQSLSSRVSRLWQRLEGGKS